MFDAAREQRAKVRADVQRPDLDSRWFADAHLAEIHRHSRIDRRGDAADRDRLTDRLRELFGKRRTRVVLGENGSRPQEKHCRENGHEKNGANESFLEHRPARFGRLFRRAIVALLPRGPPLWLRSPVRDDQAPGARVNFRRRPSS